MNGLSIEETVSIKKKKNYSHSVLRIIESKDDDIVFQKEKLLNVMLSALRQCLFCNVFEQTKIK